MIIEYDWQGYLINHLLVQDNRHYQSHGRVPSDINWKTQLRMPLVERSLDIKFLWVAKVYELHHDPDTEESLETPIPIVLEEYDYGDWVGGIPSKQDKRAYFYFGKKRKDNCQISLDKEESRFIPRNRSTITEREKIVSKRRQFALSFLQGRAKEIDIATGYKLKLEQTIKGFFDTFDREIRAYLSYGSTDILDVLVNAPDEWLEIELPGFGTIRAELIRIMSEALEIPTKQEIENKINSEIG